MFDRFLNMPLINLFQVNNKDNLSTVKVIQIMFKLLSMKQTFKVKFLVNGTVACKFQRYVQGVTL